MAVDLLLDSSFLIFLVETPSGGFTEIEDKIGKVEPIVLTSVIKELRRIADRAAAKRAKAASRALDYASGLRRVPQTGSGSVDDQILLYAKSSGAAVATLDTELRRRLRAAGVVVVTLSGNRLVAEGR
ncbi:MAG: hypothetical protein A3K61_07230 [Thaumarchaeota archaeon RBG_16_49_8]|nr:MAG: hypothetical protein A3K61_07230 [Thaumarchaeota archaeon RBG_16_49_8]